MLEFIQIYTLYEDFTQHMVSLKNFLNKNAKFVADRQDEEFLEIMRKKSSELTDFSKEIKIKDDGKYDLTV